MRALCTQDMPYARPSSGGSVPLSPAVDAEAVCQQICSTTILHQGSHTNTHQMKPQSTVPNYETAWGKKFTRGNSIHHIRHPWKTSRDKELVDYFQTTYVTATYRSVQRNGEQRLTMRRVPPMFPPSIWSVPPATVDSDPRTNNVCEGWNNKFFTLIGSAHPSISIWTCM
jgi:hypothetical protein